MEMRKIGSLEVSPIGMGCMGFSHGYGKAPEEHDSIRAIQSAYEFGCTHFDTAEGYGKEQFYAGHNEELVGKAVAPFRKKITLATKLHIRPEKVQGRSLYDVMRQHLEHSLKNLRTDYADLYYLHRVNEEVPFLDVAEVMGRFREEGLIREWGMSQISAEMLAKAHAVTPVAAVQNLYSMMERDCEQDIFPYCLEHGITVVPFSPIASGFLSGKVKAVTEFEAGDDVRKWVPQLSQENIQANQPILEVLEKFADKKNATKAQISLVWMLHKYPNVVPIPGARKQEHILENLGAWNVSLTEEEFRELETALNACTVYGHRGHVETEQTSFGRHWTKK